MATNIPGMRKGFCINIGNCDKANTKEEITIGIGEEFVCPDCGGALAEIKPKKGIPAWIWALVAVVVVGGGVGGYLALSGEEEVPVAEIVLTESALTLTEGESAHINATAMPIEATNPALTYTSADEQVATVTGPEVTGVKAGKTTVTITAQEGAVSNSIEVTVKAKAKTRQEGPTYPTVGTFSGKLKNGYPHGTGTLTFSSQRLIDAHDSQGRVAEAGDYLIGEWDNGHLVQARWYDASNTLKETIIIGKAMDPEKDQPLGRFKKL